MPDERVDPAAAAPPPRRGCLRRLTLAGAGLLVLALAGLGAAWSQRARWLAPWLTDEIVRRVREATGAELTIGGLGGGWLRDVELHEVAWRDPSDDAGLPELDLRRARVEFSAWELLRRPPGWLGRLRVEVEGVRLVLRAGGQRASEPGTWELPAAWPALAAREVELQVRGGQSTLELTGGRLDVEPATGAASQPATLRAERLTWRRPAAEALGAPLEARLAWSGSRLELVDVRLADAARARASWLELGQAARGRLEWRLELETFGGRLAGGGSLERGVLEQRFDLDGARLEQGLAFTLPDLAAPPQMALTGRGRLHLESGRPEALRVEWSGEARDVRAYGRALEELEVDGYVQGRRLLARRVLARRGQDRLEATDLELPLSSDGMAVLRGARGAVELSLSDVPAWIEGGDGRLARIAPAHSAELALRLSADGLRLEHGLLATAGGRFAVRPSTVTWGPGGLAGGRVDLAFDVDFRDLAGLGAVLASERPWGGSLRGELLLSGSRDQLSGRCDLQGREVVAQGLELGELRAVASVSAQELVVETFEAQGGLGRVSLDGRWAWAEERLEDVRLSLSTEAPQALLPTVFSGGALELEARLSGSWRDPRGQLEASAGGLALVALPGRVLDELALSGELDAGRVEIAALSARAEQVELEARGELAHEAWGLPLGLELEALRVRRGGLDLALSAPARAGLEPGRVWTSPWLMEGSAGRLAVERLERRDGELAVSARFEDLDPMPLLEPFVARGFLLDGVRGELEIETEAGSPSVSAGLSIARLRAAAGAPELSLEAQGRFADGRVALDRLEVDAGPSGRVSLRGQAPFDPFAEQPLSPGALELTGELSLPTLEDLPGARLREGLRLEGELGASFALRGAWDRLGGGASIESRLAVVAERGGGTPLFGPARVALRAELGDVLRLDQLVVDSPEQIYVESRGRLETALDVRRLWREGASALLDAPLELVGDLTAQDLGVLARFLPGLRRVAGEVTGAFALAGTPRAPIPAGRLELSGGEARLEGDFPALRDLSAVVLIERGRARVESLSGELGGGSLGLTGELDWSLGEPTADFVLVGREALLVQRPTLRVRADAALAVRGPLDALELSGRITVRDGRYTRNVDLFGAGGRPRPGAGAGLRLFSFPAGPLGSMGFDVSIDSAEPFRVANNLANGSVQVALNLVGTGAAPELYGTLFVDPSRVSLPASVLRTTAGTIRFERDEPLVPQLDVRLTTRVRGYDIAVRVEGPAEAPAVELSSVPPLPSEDVLLLVLTGKPPEAAWNAQTSEQAAQTVAVFLGKDLLTRWMSGGDGPSEDESLLDRIEYRTGADVTQSGGETAELAIRITGSAEGAGRTVWLRAEDDVYDRTNFGIRFVIRMR